MRRSDGSPAHHLRRFTALGGRPRCPTRRRRRARDPPPVPARAMTGAWSDAEPPRRAATPPAEWSSTDLARRHGCWPAPAGSSPHSFLRLVHLLLATGSAPIYQALVDAELSSVIGAGPWEHTAERSGVRNGYRP